MTLRSGFDHELDVLKSNITDMGIQVEHSYNNLFRAIALREENVIHEILENNRYISDMERNIESRCLSIITRQQPVAKDLRTVSAILKVVTDIERIGDHVIDIAELSERFLMRNLSTYSKHIIPMADAAREMMHNGIEAFVMRNLEQARQVIEEDDVVDEMFNKVKNDLVVSLKTDAKDADECIDILMIAKYLEKIGDHAVNMGEWEIFQETGTMNNVHMF